MNREQGHYWCLHRGEWVVAHWEGGMWWLIGADDCYEDSIFEQIDDRRILRTP